MGAGSPGVFSPLLSRDIALLWSHPAGKNISGPIVYTCLYIYVDSAAQDAEASVFSRHIVYTFHEFTEFANSKTHAALALADNVDE